MQHYKYVPHFHHNGIRDLEMQIDRDVFKEILCAENDVTLIVIPYTHSYVKPDDLRQYIINEIVNYCPKNIIKLYGLNRTKKKTNLKHKQKIIEV